MRAELHRERKRLLILIHLLALLIYAYSFSRSVHSQESSIMLELEGIFFLLLLLNLYLLIRLERLGLSALFMLFLVSVASLVGIVALVDNALVVKEMYWTVVIVPGAYYLTGRRGGALISMLLLTAIWGIYLYYRHYPGSMLSKTSMIDFSGIYLAITAISLLYAHSQSLNIKRIMHYSQDLAFANDELKIAALTDTLTCSYNRKFLDEFLHELTTNRQHSTFSLIMMDIDHFKDVNDKHGHQMGDDILKAVTKCLETQLRDRDILGRWGGEEFILISQDLGAETAYHLAERLRAFIESFEFPRGLKITCSFGVVEWSKSENETQLIKRADNALYEAKKTGRNRCVMASETGPV